MKIFESIKKWFKKDIPAYPIPFALVLYSENASESGIRDSQNKIIQHYFYNQLGFLSTKEYPYSEERVHSLEKERGIPVYDKTQKEERFPVFGKIMPQEISFMTK